MKSNQAHNASVAPNKRGRRPKAADKQLSLFQELDGEPRPEQSESFAIEAIDLVLETAPEPAAEIHAEKELFARELLTELDNAAALATDGQIPTEAERQYLQRIEGRMRAVKKDIIRRNFDLLALFRGNHWREQYTSLEDFAREHAGLSAKHLRKVLDETRQAELFLRAGLYRICPEGQYAQLLLQVADDERKIEAWEYARIKISEHGKSRDNVRDALRDYCSQREIAYGRRKESQKERERRLQRSVKKTTCLTDTTPCLNVATLANILSPRTLALLAGTCTDGDLEAAMMAALGNLSANRSNDRRAATMRTMLNRLRETDREIFHRLTVLGLIAIAEKIEECALQYCKAGKGEAENDPSPAVSTAPKAKLVE
jgi:hypothetical protein